MNILVSLFIHDHICRLLQWRCHLEGIVFSIGCRECLCNLLVHVHVALKKKHALYNVLLSFIFWPWSHLYCDLMKWYRRQTGAVHLQDLRMEDDCHAGLEVCHPGTVHSAPNEFCLRCLLQISSRSRTSSLLFSDRCGPGCTQGRSPCRDHMWWRYHSL